MKTKTKTIDIYFAHQSQDIVAIAVRITEIFEGEPWHSGILSPSEEMGHPFSQSGQDDDDDDEDDDDHDDDDECHHLHHLSLKRSKKKEKQFRLTVYVGITKMT